MGHTKKIAIHTGTCLQLFANWRPPAYCKLLRLKWQQFFYLLYKHVKVSNFSKENQQIALVVGHCLLFNFEIISKFLDGLWAVLLEQAATWWRILSRWRRRSSIEWIVEVQLRRSSTGVNFTNILRAAFTHADPESAKNTVKLSVFFCTFGIWAGKSCSLNVGKIDFRTYAMEHQRRSDPESTQKRKVMKMSSILFNKVVCNYYLCNY